MSPTSATSPKQTRRRGAELDTAILAAAWDQLLTEGYARFSIDNVAARAQTSKPVIYRRFASSDELLLAAIRARGASVRERAVLPDTGSLRGDVLALLVEVNADQGGLAALFSSFVAVHYESDSRLTPGLLREEFLGAGPSRMDAVVQRAVQRGEVDPSRLTARVIGLPFALLRQELMLTLDRAPLAVLEEIVDEVFLPLVRAAD